MPRGLIADAALALISAFVVSLCVAAWCVYMVFGVHLVDIDTWVADGRDPWTVSHHEALGVGWVNAAKMYAPLVSPIDEAGAPPWWAVSGGADSLALLHALQALPAAERPALWVAHFL